MKLLTLMLGFTGIHHFILKRHYCGTYFLLTFGGLGIGWLVDIFRIKYLTESFNLQVLLFIIIGYLVLQLSFR